MPLHLTRNTSPHIFGHLWRVVLVGFSTCKLVNWQSSEKRRMIINLTMFYTINLVNFFFWLLVSVEKHGHHQHHVNENQELVPGNSTRVNNVIFSFP